MKKKITAKKLIPIFEEGTVGYTSSNANANGNMRYLDIGDSKMVGASNGFWVYLTEEQSVALVKYASNYFWVGQEIAEALFSKVGQDIGIDVAIDKLVDITQAIKQYPNEKEFEKKYYNYVKHHADKYTKNEDTIPIYTKLFNMLDVSKSKKTNEEIKELHSKINGQNGTTNKLIGYDSCELFKEFLEKKSIDEKRRYSYFPTRFAVASMDLLKQNEIIVNQSEILKNDKIESVKNLKAELDLGYVTWLRSKLENNEISMIEYGKLSSPKKIEKVFKEIDENLVESVLYDFLIDNRDNNVSNRSFIFNTKTKDLKLMPQFDFNCGGIWGLNDNYYTTAVDKVCNENIATCTIGKIFDRYKQITEYAGRSIGGENNSYDEINDRTYLNYFAKNYSKEYTNFSEKLANLLSNDISYFEKVQSPFLAINRIDEIDGLSKKINNWSKVGIPDGEFLDYNERKYDLETGYDRRKTIDFIIAYSLKEKDEIYNYQFRKRDAIFLETVLLDDAHQILSYAPNHNQYSDLLEKIEDRQEMLNDINYFEIGGLENYYNEDTIDSSYIK